MMELNDQKKNLKSNDNKKKGSMSSFSASNTGGVDSESKKRKILK